MAIPCMMNRDGCLFLIHCEPDARRTYLDAAIIVVEPTCPGGWIPIVAPNLYGGILMAVQLPVEFLGRDSRYKGYHVRLPLREERT